MAYEEVVQVPQCNVVGLLGRGHITRLRQHHGVKIRIQDADAQNADVCSVRVVGEESQVLLAVSELADIVCSMKKAYLIPRSMICVIHRVYQ